MYGSGVDSKVRSNKTMPVTMIFFLKSLQSKHMRNVQKLIHQ